MYVIYDNRLHPFHSFDVEASCASYYSHVQAHIKKLLTTGAFHSGWMNKLQGVAVASSPRATKLISFQYANSVTDVLKNNSLEPVFQALGGKKIALETWGSYLIHGLDQTLECCSRNLPLNQQKNDGSFLAATKSPGTNSTKMKVIIYASDISLCSGAVRRNANSHIQQEGYSGSATSSLDPEATSRIDTVCKKISTMSDMMSTRGVQLEVRIVCVLTVASLPTESPGGAFNISSEEIRESLLPLRIYLSEALGDSVQFITLANTALCFEEELRSIISDSSPTAFARISLPVVQSNTKCSLDISIAPATLSGADSLAHTDWSKLAIYSTTSRLEIDPLHLEGSGLIVRPALRDAFDSNAIFRQNRVSFLGLAKLLAARDTILVLTAEDSDRGCLQYWAIIPPASAATSSTETTRSRAISAAFGAATHTGSSLASASSTEVWKGGKGKENDPQYGGFYRRDTVDDDSELYGSMTMIRLTDKDNILNTVYDLKERDAAAERVRKDKEKKNKKRATSASQGRNESLGGIVGGSGRGNANGGGRSEGMDDGADTDDDGDGDSDKMEELMIAQEMEQYLEAALFDDTSSSTSFESHSRYNPMACPSGTLNMQVAEMLSKRANVLSAYNSSSGTSGGGGSGSGSSVFDAARAAAFQQTSPYNTTSSRGEAVGGGASATTVAGQRSQLSMHMHMRQNSTDSTSIIHGNRSTAGLNYSNNMSGNQGVVVQSSRNRAATPSLIHQAQPSAQAQAQLKMQDRRSPQTLVTSSASSTVPVSAQQSSTAPRQVQRHTARGTTSSNTTSNTISVDLSSSAQGVSRPPMSPRSYTVSYQDSHVTNTTTNNIRASIDLTAGGDGGRRASPVNFTTSMMSDANANANGMGMRRPNDATEDSRDRAYSAPRGRGRGRGAGSGRGAGAGAGRSRGRGDAGVDTPVNDDSRRSSDGGSRERMGAGTGAGGNTENGSSRDSYNRRRSDGGGGGNFRSSNDREASRSPKRDSKRAKVSFLGDRYGGAGSGGEAVAEGEGEGGRGSGGQRASVEEIEDIDDFNI